MADEAEDIAKRGRPAMRNYIVLRQLWLADGRHFEGEVISMRKEDADDLIKSGILERAND